MDSDRCEDSGEMYSPDDQGEYTPLDGAPRFSMQGLSNALADVGEGITQPPAEEYAMMLEVTMANRPHPPVFSWNVGMVMHVLKNDPVLRELEHCRWMAQGLPICSSMISRTTVVWVRKLRMRSGLTWRRLFQSGSHGPPTSPLASYLWWKPGSELSLPPNAEG